MGLVPYHVSSPKGQDWQMPQLMVAYRHHPIFQMFYFKSSMRLQERIWGLCYVFPPLPNVSRAAPSSMVLELYLE